MTGAQSNVDALLPSLIAAHVLCERLTHANCCQTAAQWAKRKHSAESRTKVHATSTCVLFRYINTPPKIHGHKCTKHDTMAVTNDTPVHSLDSLEARLHRISYALNGDQDIEEASTTPSLENGTAASRLRNLERQMQTLASKSSVVDQVLKLQSKHPEIFTGANGAEQPNTLPLPSQAALVLSHAKLYSTISGQLQSLQESSVPKSTSASKLRDLQPRIDKAAARQEQQAIELAELRSRSAAAVEKWYETGVLGMAERWAEWEERMRDVEIVVRRMEAVKKRDEELV
jgi:hypothetical protein